MTAVYRDFPQSLEVNSELSRKIGHDRFFLPPLQFVIHIRLSIQPYMCVVEDIRL